MCDYKKKLDAYSKKLKLPKESYFTIDDLIASHNYLRTLNLKQGKIRLAHTSIIIEQTREQIKKNLEEVLSKENIIKYLTERI